MSIGFVRKVYCKEITSLKVSHNRHKLNFLKKTRNSLRIKFKKVNLNLKLHSKSHSNKKSFVFETGHFSIAF